MPSDRMDIHGCAAFPAYDKAVGKSIQPRLEKPDKNKIASVERIRTSGAHMDRIEIRRPSAKQEPDILAMRDRIRDSVAHELEAGNPRRMDALRQSIRTGGYTVDAQAVASRMLGKR